MADVYCPICARLIDWERTPPYRIGTGGQAEPLVQDPRESEASWRDRLTMAYRPCGDPSQRSTHLLPYDYADYTPVTIGMVGHSKAGKTHLLAAMIHGLFSNDPVLDRVGLQADPLDLRVHQRYVAECVTPLIVQRKQLPGTSADVPVTFCDALKVTNAQQKSFAVTFFDLAGERLIRTDDNDEVRFYASADALMFVVDPDTLPKRGGPQTVGDTSFEVALRRLEGRKRPQSSDRFFPVAAAVVVAKADLIRFRDRLVSDWLATASAEEEVQLETVERESEDVYAYLRDRGARRWLYPAEQCWRSTLHFVSATNGPAVDGRYPDAFRQCRTLKPLLSVFAMTGILDESLLSPSNEERR